jgi:hypothetical protein
VGLYLIPSPLQTPQLYTTRSSSHTTVAVLGSPDTNRVSLPDVTGFSDEISDISYSTPEQSTLVIPDYVENEQFILEKDFQGQIRATAYPYVDGDTLRIDLPLEWMIQPTQLEITRADTVFTMDSVFIITPRPWYTQPEVVAPSTAIVTLLLVAFLQSLNK